MQAPIQHPAGEHALLADGRTAALMAPDGEVAWLCWPRIDSDPVLFSLLDAVAGGTFRLSPRESGFAVTSRGYIEDGLVLRTTWSSGRVRLVVEDALAWDGRPGLLRMLRAEGAPVIVELRFRPAPGFGAAPPEVRESARRAVAAGAGLLLAVDAPAPWRIEDGVAVAIFKVVPGYPTGVAFGDARDSVGLGDLPERMSATLRHWRSTMAAVALSGLDTSPLAAVTGSEVATTLMLRSAAVLSGLHQRGGGIVAAPTTSLPQWPRSDRTWDYRYSWTRDAALAGRALARLGLLDEAHTLGAVLGDLSADGVPPPLVRVDESAAPPEREVAGVAGHGGACPVRVGNAAAAQSQLDVLGEVLEFALVLARSRALPESLRRAVAGLADAAAAGWRLPDHGIWEIRGAARPYTHSRVLAWSGLRAASMLVRSGACSGDVAGWTRAAADLRRHVLATAVDATGALTLTEGGGGPDAALAEAVTTGFLAPEDPRARATLDSIDAQLNRGGLLERHRAELDPSPTPCAPFVFPSLWMAMARRRIGDSGSEYLRAVVRARGVLDLLGECADPTTPQPLGNYPQVQSHASLILAALPDD